MEGQACSWGDSRTQFPASARSCSVDLAQFSVRTPSSTHSIHGRVSSIRSIGGFSQTEGMSEEMRFKLDMRKMELEVERERELKKFKLEAEEMRLKTDEAGETSRLETEEKQSCLKLRRRQRCMRGKKLKTIGFLSWRRLE